MPVKFLVLAQVPRYARMQAVHGAAEIQVAPGGEGEPPQLADSDVGGIVQFHRQDVSSLVHGSIVPLIRRVEKVLINPLLSPNPGGM